MPERLSMKLLSSFKLTPSQATRAFNKFADSHLWAPISWKSQHYKEPKIVPTLIPFYRLSFSCDIQGEDLNEKPRRYSEQDLCIYGSNTYRGCGMEKLASIYIRRGSLMNWEGVIHEEDLMNIDGTAPNTTAEDNSVEKTDMPLIDTALSPETICQSYMNSESFRNRAKRFYSQATGHITVSDMRIENKKLMYLPTYVLHGGTEFVPKIRSFVCAMESGKEVEPLVIGQPYFAFRKAFIPSLFFLSVFDYGGKEWTDSMLGTNHYFPLVILPSILISTWITFSSSRTIRKNSKVIPEPF